MGIRWLILPDIHDKVRQASRIIEREPHDRLLLMGDYFDSFQTGVTDAADTAIAVKEWLNMPGTTCLLGNHDVSYGWGRLNPRLLCPGYDPAKWIVINRAIRANDWLKFRLHAWLDGGERPWLVTHAGLHPVFVQNVIPDRYREVIDNLCDVAREQLNLGEEHPLLARGTGISGDDSPRGLDWLYWAELAPIPGLNQLTAHTQAASVRCKETTLSRNLCLDTNLRYYAVFQNGELETKRYDDLIARK